MKLAILMLIAMMLAACGSSGTPAAPTTQELGLDAADIKFSVTTLEVSANQPVRLSFTNSGTLDHDFTVAEISVSDVKMEGDMGMDGHAMGHMADPPDLHIAVRPGGTGVLTFTPTAPGRYEFECTVAGHKEAGMAGTLVVK